MRLDFKIRNQMIERIDRYTVVADSQNYLTAFFAFDTDDWADLSKTAVFSYGEDHYTVLLVNDECAVPWEAIKSTGFYVSVFGGDRITANSLYVPVMQSGYAEGETPSDPTPDVYAQIVELMEEQAFDAKLAESYTHGDTGVRENEATDNAKYYKEQAEISKTDAQSYAGTASEKAEQTTSDRASVSKDKQDFDIALSEFTSNTLSAAIQAVNEQGSSEMGRVNDEGNAQVSAVNEAGAIQIGLATAQADRAEGEADKAQVSEGRAKEYKDKIIGMTVSANTLTPGQPATVDISETSSNITMTLGIPKGEKGNVMYATFEVDPLTGILTMTTPDEYAGATFGIDENGYIYAEVA